ncbi:MAG: hypothetical protein HC890_01610 [Chloroflexaceae bacterium]|nr:hypothetical protein [Chloroflexaceae bacterium]
MVSMKVYGNLDNESRDKQTHAFYYSTILASHKISSQPFGVCSPQEVSNITVFLWGLLSSGCDRFYNRESP